MTSSPSLPLLRRGEPLASARGATILLHGRGSSGEEIAGLAGALPQDGIAYLAPSAPGGSWYPQRFLVPRESNEPSLSRALQVIASCVREITETGISLERVGLVGFSQGACLALDYAARHPARYGFVAGLSGALIGPLDTPLPLADLAGTPVLLGCAEADPHIPVEYVERSAETLKQAHAIVTKQIYRGSAHTVFPPEIEWLTQQLQRWR